MFLSLLQNINNSTICASIRSSFSDRGNALSRIIFDMAVLDVLVRQGKKNINTEDKKNIVYLSFFSMLTCSILRTSLWNNVLRDNNIEYRDNNIEYRDGLLNDIRYAFLYSMMNVAPSLIVICLAELVTSVNTIQDVADKVENNSFANNQNQRHYIDNISSEETNIPIVNVPSNTLCSVLKGSFCCLKDNITKTMNDMVNIFY